MSFSLIREDGAPVISASGKGSKGEGTRSWLCLFPDQTQYWNHAARGLLGQRNTPHKVCDHQGSPWGILSEHFFQNVVCKADRSTHPQLHHGDVLCVGSHPSVWALFAPWVASVMNSINFTFLSTVKRSKPFRPLLVLSWGEGKTPSWKHLQL